MDDTFRDVTADEILAEIRGRERARAVPSSMDGGAKRATRSAGDGQPGRATRGRRLDRLSDAELPALLKDLQRAIYGKDDRVETHSITDGRTMALADASVAVVATKDLKPAGHGWTLRTTSYRAEYELCPDETFSKQRLGCFCSGVLVRPDVIATAGHCVKNAAELATMRFVFGFRILKDTPDAARVKFGPDDVYQGKRLVGRVFTESKADWALVQLDRPVVGRTPVTLRKSGKIAGTTRLFVIGHPCGLPQKFAGGARVTNNKLATHFSATLDTYGGNSGSPVFNEKTYALEGLLVRGQTDFVSNGTCNVSAVFPTTGADGEDVTRTSEWRTKLPGGKTKPSKMKIKSNTAKHRAKTSAKAASSRARAKARRRTSSSR